MRSVQIFDTTLRDGEQSPGVNLSKNEKVEIALQLERLGVNIIESGFAASSLGDFQAIQEVAKQVKNSIVCSLSRSIINDIDQSWQALKHATHPGVHIFIATSPIHREYKLRMTKEQVMEQAVQAVRHARKYFPHVEFSCEDAARTEMDFLCEMAAQMVQEGVDVLNLPDTVGYLMPSEYAQMFREVQQRVPEVERLKLSAHCHDDLGLAVANSLAAIEAGVEQIEGTINGIGERAGNASLEEVIMAVQTRSDYHQLQTSICTQEITRTSRLVSRLTGMPVPSNKAIVGANAFAHESGIHQDGMLKNPETYEIMTPETVGLRESRLVLGKHSGRHAFRERLEQLGYTKVDEELKTLFKRFKELSLSKKEITDQDIVALVEERLGDPVEYFTLEAVNISYGSHSVPSASLRIKDQQKDRMVEEAACGNGSVDAIFNTIDRITKEKVQLVDYQIHSVTQGTDALGEVSVQLKQDELTVQGRGVSTDVLDASARAYVDAINRLIRRRTEVNKGATAV